MMHRVALFTLVSLTGGFAAAQPNTPPPAQQHAPTQLQAANLPVDPQKLATAVNGSFYHPDKLNGIACEVSGDWPAMFKTLKVAPPEPRMKAISALKTRYTAARNKTPELTFDWTDGPPDTKDEFETGMTQILGGFYQSYWTVMAAPPLESGSDIARVEPQTDGTTKLYEAYQTSKVVITLDKNDTPTHYEFDTPAAKGEFDMQYAASPKPVPGDLRRISYLHINSKVGDSNYNVALSMTYQPLGEFFVPRRVRFEIIGAYTVALEFTGCSVLKPEAAGGQTAPAQ